MNKGDGSLNKPTKPYILWRYYGGSGWAWAEYGTLADISMAILQDGIKDAVVTKRLDLRVEVNEQHVSGNR